MWGEHSRADVIHRVVQREDFSAEVWSLERARVCPSGAMLSPDLIPPAASYSDGPLTLVPGGLSGHARDAARGGLREKLRAMLEEDLDALLLSHAEPSLSEGHVLLDELLVE